MACHQWNLTRMPFECHSKKRTHHNMKAHDTRHQEASSVSHQEAAAADTGTTHAIVLVEESGTTSRSSMDRAVRDAVLLRRNGMVGGRAAVAAPEPGPRKHNRPPAAAQEPQGLGGHAGDTSVGPAGLDGNGLPIKHGDVASLPAEASDTGQPGNPPLPPTQRARPLSRECCLAWAVVAPPTKIRQAIMVEGTKVRRWHRAPPSKYQRKGTQTTPTCWQCVPHS